MAFSCIGDLTADVQDCGMFRKLYFSAHESAGNDEAVEIPLSEPMNLDVGDQGVIGRRVSVFSTAPPDNDTVMAEGIVGFNFAPVEK